MLIYSHTPRPLWRFLLCIERLRLTAPPLYSSEILPIALPAVSDFHGMTTKKNFAASSVRHTKLLSSPITNLSKSWLNGGII